MRKLVSLLLAVIIVVSVSVVSFSAFDRALTEIEVNSGDTVVYTLKADKVSELVICADYSIYYDDSMFDFVSYSNEPKSSVVNDKLPGEVRGNWSNLSGIDFSKPTPIITVELKAKSSGKTNINYYMRDFCCDQDNEIVEIGDYEFMCSVDVNNSSVIDNQPAELNVDVNQDIGSFNNSASGSSKDAGIIISDGITNIEYGKVAENLANDVNGDEVNENKVQSNTNKEKETQKADSKTNNGSTTATNGAGKEATSNNITKSSSNNAPVTNQQNQSGGPSVYLWIIIGVVVLAALAVGGYFIYKKKKGNTPPTDTDTPDNQA